MVNLRDPARSRKGSSRNPPASSSWRCKAPSGRQGSWGVEEQGVPQKGETTSLGELPPEAPGKAPYPPPLFLLGRSHRDGEVGAATSSPPGTEHGCDWALKTMPFVTQLRTGESPGGGKLETAVNPVTWASGRGGKKRGERGKVRRKGGGAREIPELELAKSAEEWERASAN